MEKPMVFKLKKLFFWVFLMVLWFLGFNVESQK